MARQSGGLLVYRKRTDHVEVFLVHPGGPFWQHKDLGAWSIPKGEFSDDEDPLEAAQREFFEETAVRISGPFLPLQPITQRGGKIVHVWVGEGNFDADRIKSNSCKMEWPRGSGKFQEFPEVDRAAWFTFERASEKILESQRPLLTQLASLLESKMPNSGMFENDSQ